MRNSGVIFYCTKLLWQRRLGFLFLFLSLVGFSLFISPWLTPYLVKEEKVGFKPFIDQEVKSVMAQEDKQELNYVYQPEIKNFLLTIEKIGLKNAHVIPEVNVNNPFEYKQALSQGLVHAQGTALPNEGKLVYIFGHSTNYPWFVEQINALFYQIDKLEVGDRIKIEYNGQHYLYYIYEKQIVAPDDVSLVKERKKEDILVLQSCYPPGTTWQRLLLFARPTEL